MSSTPSASLNNAPRASDGLAFAPPNRALTTFGLALASFMQVLDTTIANVSLPAISGNLGGSANQATWVITSFAVSTAIALPLTGWLTRHFGERKLFMWSTMAFVIASFLCGMAHSMGLLVAARALQGLVAGPMYPVTQALLLSIYPPARRGQAIALLAMVTVVAPIAGPILGGWITDNYSWEWIFFINIPIGIFASTVVGRQLKGRPERLEKPKMDYIGLATLVAFTLVLEPLGWLISATLLFVGMSLALGGRHHLRALVIGLGLASLIQVVFSGLLGMQLPAGILGV